MKWHIYDSGKQLPQSLMDKDASFLQSLSTHQEPLLHVYEWRGPCLTYGYFTDPFLYLKPNGLDRHGLQIARRPTGGGIIFHLTDFAFSVLLPASHPAFSLNTLENYYTINQWTAKALSSVLGHAYKPQLLAHEPVCKEAACHAFCMAKPTQYDLVIHGKKAGGAAQRRTRYGLLHQGSLSLFLPPSQILEDVLIYDQVVMQAMQQHSYALFAQTVNPTCIADMRQALKQAVQDVFMQS